MTQKSKPKFAPTSKRQAQFLQSDTYLNIFGGAASGGKSFQGLMRFLKYVHEPEFVGYVFRKNGTDIKKEGGLFSAAVKMFQEYDPRVTYTKQPMVIHFPHPSGIKGKKGASISFTGLDDQEGMNAIQGINISAAMIDEATQIGEEEFWWLLTRLRTDANMSPNVWLTCNPDSNSFVLLQFVHWWLYPRGTIADVVETDIYSNQLKDIQINDQVFVHIYEGDKFIKEYDTAGHITFRENIKFFGVAGSLSVNRKAVEDAAKVFTSIPRLKQGQEARLILKRGCPIKREYIEVFSQNMTVMGQEDVGGRPDIEKNGKMLYYLNVDNKVHLAETLDELYTILPDYRDHPTIEPKTVRFLGATCKDNPTYLLKNPSYESTLQNQPRLKREQLYYGNWYATEEGAGYFRREWVEPLITKMPPESQIKRRVRCFDLAGSVPTENNPDPDYTVGLLMCKTTDDRYIIEDVIRFRKRAGEVENAVIDIVAQDRKMYGSNYQAYLPQDPAAAGQTARVYYSKMFASRGVPIRFVKVGSQNSKLKRFEPFAASAENGLVQVLKADWNQEFFYELEVFDGTRKTRHDD